MSFADLRVSDRLPAYYEGLTGDHEAGGSPTVVFRYVEAGEGDEPEGGVEQTVPIASQDTDPAIDWDDQDGVQAVAQAVLEHYTGSEPGQAALEALVMSQGDRWAAASGWTLTITELDEIL